MQPYSTKEIDRIDIMKSIFTLCLIALGLATQPVLAQTDKKAKEILDASNKKISELKTLKSDFKLELLGGGNNDSKTGTFYMKGDKFRIEMEGKDLIIMSDNETSWTYMKATNEIQATAYNPDEQTLSPAKLLTNFYDKEYNYKYVGLRKIEGKPCDVIELTPKSTDKAFSKVQLAVDKNRQIVGGQVWEKNGNTYRYSLSNYKTNITLTDDLFTYTKKEFPDAEMIDLR